MRQTFMANESNIERKWYVIDAEGQTLGRLSSEVAAILRGKNKVTYTPHVDTGDYVIIINASKIEFTMNEVFSCFTVSIFSRLILLKIVCLLTSNSSLNIFTLFTQSTLYK